MPKLKDEVIIVSNAAGAVYRAVLAASVSQTGQFTLSIPDELQEIAVAAVNEWRRETMFLTLVKQLYVCKGMFKQEMVEFLKHCAQTFVDRQTTHSLVILYLADTQYNVVAFEGAARVYANGKYAEAAGDTFTGFDWVKRNFSVMQPRVWHSNNAGCTPFGFVLAARVFNKYTTVSGDKQTHRYELVRGQQVLDLEPWAAHLNSYQVELPYLDINLVNEMPYTEQAASFFCHAIHQIAQAALMFDMFFKSDQLPQLIAQRGDRGLLAFTPVKREGD